MYRTYFKTPGGSKYRNVKQTYQGYSYDSKKEAIYAAYLDQRVKDGEIKSWDRQFKVTFMANGKTICNYYVDFRTHNPDGSYTLIEVKGFETAIWRLKVKLLQILWLPEHPEYEYIVER